MLVGKKVNLVKVLNILYPASRDMSERQKKANDEVKGLITSILNNKSDLQNFRNTAWGAYNAIADYRSNAEPRRKTATYADHKMAAFLDGDPVMKQAQDIIMELTA
jgi:hypothetical protein